ncbi:MAG: PilZ domain-containing protein [Thermomonas sp.]
MGRESRRMHRRDVAGMVDVIDTMTAETMGHLGNLSVGGMLLIASVPLADDGLYQCRFVLPDTGDGSIEVGAHVLWVQSASAPGQSWAGVRFLGLDPDTTRRLRAWCQPTA